MDYTTLQHLVAQHIPQAQPIYQQWLALEQRLDHLPNAVVYGVYNSGKSSLLNALTGNVQNEYFATRDIPETRTTKRLEQDGLCYVDTPGLDVNEADTQTANKGVTQADLVIFVHKLNAGPIQMNEMQIMKQMMADHTKPEQIIGVITGAETASESPELVEEITAQLHQLVPNMPVYLVSNTMFKKGVLENKPSLVHASGIPQLTAWMQAQSQQMQQRIKAQRQQKCQYLKEQLLKATREQLKQIRQQHKKMEKAEKNRQQAFMHQVQQLQELAKEYKAI